MKLTIDQDNVVLKIQTTGEEEEFETIKLPTDNIHHWYPFNINFQYKYSNSKGYMYLTKEKSYDGENIYKVDILKRTKPLPKRDGVPFHKEVFHRNEYIMDKASLLGLPVLRNPFTLEDVESGFSELGYIIHTVKTKIEDRLLEQEQESFIFPDMFSEAWDKSIFEIMTEEERNVLTEFGEMYSMLTVMRKLAEEE